MTSRERFMLQFAFVVSCAIVLFTVGVVLGVLVGVLSPSRASAAFDTCGFYANPCWVRIR